MSTTPTPETFAQKLDRIEAEHALIRPYARDDRPAFWGTGHGPDNDDEMSEMSGARSAG